MSTAVITMPAQWGWVRWLTKHSKQQRLNDNILTFESWQQTAIKSHRQTSTCVKASPKRKRHGMSNTPEYISFAAAKQRCTNSRCKQWNDYGGRGIEFRSPSFQDFYAELGDKPEPKELYSVDRYPDNNGHYEIGNVRWATSEQQANNRRPKSAVLADKQSLMRNRCSVVQAAA